MIPDFLWAVWWSGVAQLVTGFVFHVAIRNTSFGKVALQEMFTSKIFRSKDDPVMMYPVFGMPFGNALLTAIAYNVLSPAVLALKWQCPCYAGAYFGFLLWATTHLHGIFLDWTSFRISFDLSIMFMMNSLFQSVIGGGVMGWLI